MTHVVHHLDADGTSVWETAVGLDAALEKIEALQHTGTSGLRVYGEVPIRIETIYRVSVAARATSATTNEMSTVVAPAAGVTTSSNGVGMVHDGVPLAGAQDGAPAGGAVAGRDAATGGAVGGGTADTTTDGDTPDEAAEVDDSTLETGPDDTGPDDTGPDHTGHDGTGQDDTGSSDDTAHDDTAHDDTARVETDVVVATAVVDAEASEGVADPGAGPVEAPTIDTADEDAILAAVGAVDETVFAGPADEQVVADDAGVTTSQGEGGPVAAVEPPPGSALLGPPPSALETIEPEAGTHEANGSHRRGGIFGRG